MAKPQESKIVETVKKKRALLVSVYKDSREKDLCKEHLDELELLCETFGVDIDDKMLVCVRKFDAATLVGTGKVEELAGLAKEKNLDLIIFDDEISPAQQRNLEKECGCEVMDRTGVILEVFAQRAQTKEAQLQIELAQVKYEAPRLKRLWTHLSRQAGTAGGGGAGGGGYLKGEGEKQIEIDRRILKKRIAGLEEELDEVHNYRKTQRLARQRSEIPVFGIIGYTNAGKSTLLKALTDADVFIEDKLFATLDTTTRKYALPNNQDILLIDTVGFIRKLPHLLVAAFKSTLEESIEADILLHIIDMSHPMAIEQAETSFEVLKELGAGDKPVITVLNKVDKLENPGYMTKLRLMYPKSVQISALNKTGFDELLERMVEELQKRRTLATYRIPQSNYNVVSEIMQAGNVLHRDYEENDVVLRVDLPNAIAEKYKSYQVL